MKVSKFFVIAALLGASFMDSDNSVQAVQLSSSAKMLDFNGADEDEIMDKVFTKYSTEGKDHNGVSNGMRILMKSNGPKAASVILEATHKLKSSQVPGYIKANFDKAWDNFDINGDGFIKAEETHTFMRSLMGKLNKFALAPGSLSDIGGAGASVAASSSSDQSLAEEAPKEKKAPAPKKKAAPKKAAPKPAEELPPEANQDDADAAAVAAQLDPADAALLTSAENADQTASSDLQLAAAEMQG